MKRSPMKRTGFKSRSNQSPAIEARDGSAIKSITRLTRVPVYAPANDTVFAIPKGVKTKPGKRAPTVAEARWMTAIVEYGCIACRKDGHAPRPTAVHHILSGGQRIGHLFTLPLCDPGHHQNGKPLGMTSRHPYRAQFEERYGTELELLEELRGALNEKHKKS